MPKTAGMKKQLKKHLIDLHQNSFIQTILIVIVVLSEVMI